VDVTRQGQSAPLVTAAPIARVAEKLVYRNRFVAVYDDEVRFMNGRPGRYYRIVSGEGRPGAVIVPLAGDEVALVRTWRYAVQAWEWGFPRGYAHGNDPEQTARIELAEEIGADPLELTLLGQTWPDSAHLQAVVSVFAARMSPEAVNSEPADSEEAAEIRWLPVRDLAALIAGGAIRDGFTLAAFGLWSAWQQAREG
jgi:8-oxo-dGTP pyrophosphatase MutT (NUDIX family)